VSLSSPLGIEGLPAGEAHELLDAYHDGVLALPGPFGGWAAACLTDIDPRALTAELDRGFVGLQLPATTLLDAAGYARVGPMLELLEAVDRPLLIHPGPAGAPDRVANGAPAWWPAMVPYVQQMHAAWFAFRAHGRPRYPGLRVCFAILAGLAPLHGERFAARAGGRSPVDPGAFLEVSSYGTRAVDATIRVLGIDALVNGSDRPYADPVRLDLGVAATHALRSANAGRLLYPKEVLDDVAVAACA
jgi:6-methylsalicylate decarboxylase